ncbi:MAG: penicillin acylase family protein [Phycisphaerales bacterium]|nr:penicillin acylase family protein [Phycisphaerales bacterium]
MVKRLARLGILLLVALLLVAALGVMSVRAWFGASLPQLSGRVPLQGLADEVRVERDALGVPRIIAANWPDTARALGYVHGQDRFFQMDGARRLASGRISELVGAAAVDLDSDMRKRRLTQVASGILERLPADQRALLKAYADGVNAGLASLSARPPEYVLLRVQPEAWTERDCILVSLTMFHELSEGARPERVRAVIEAAGPPELARLLLPESSRFDQPVIADAVLPAPIAIPGPNALDLRKPPPAARPPNSPPAPADPPTNLRERTEPRGSNNWAVAGSRTADGRAILANDMHLGHSVPNVWYRAQLEWTTADGRRRRAAGVSLPGVPGIVAGSTDDLAWGFTNVTGDFEDYILIETDPRDPARYKTPDGWESFTVVTESIGIRGENPRPLPLKITRWGAVSDTDWAGRPRVLKWIAHDPAHVNLEILRMSEARTLEEGVAIARGWHGPPQNVLMASRDGRIAWVVSGWLPRREGFDGTVPVSWADGKARWAGPISEADRPVVIDPPDGILFSANSRTVPLEQSRLIGRHFGLGIRQQRIRQLLTEKPSWDERQLLDLQLDTEVAPIYGPYRELLLRAIPPDDPDAGLRRLREHAAAWTGRADADSAGFRVLHQYRAVVGERVLAGLLEPARALVPRMGYRWFLSEECVRRVLDERPPHLVPRGSASWDEFFRKAATDTLKRLSAPPGLDATWGEVHRAQIQHPLAIATRQLGAAFSGAITTLFGELSMPEDPLPGCTECVRVQTPGFGASQRTVVSPGHLGDGLLQMPTGQSGHFMSPHAADGHAAWVRGTPTPLLAGPAANVLVLTPAK